MQFIAHKTFAFQLKFDPTDNLNVANGKEIKHIIQLSHQGRFVLVLLANHILVDCFSFDIAIYAIWTESH